MDPSEDELRRVRGLVGGLPCIVWETDAATMTFTFVSEGSASILGYEPSEWVGSDSFWADRIHPDDRQRIVGRSVRVATAGGRFDEEYRLRARDGSWVWMRDVGHAVKEAGGRVVAVRGLMTPIAGRTPTDAEVVESERRFRRVVEHLPAIVYMESVARDASSLQEMLYVSPQLEEILGFTPQEWVADPAAWMQRFHPDDRERVRAEYARVERTGEPFDAEYRMYARDGRLLWFHDEAVLVRDARGEPLYWQGVMYDITAERVNEQRARASEDRYRALVDQLPAIVYQEEASGTGANLTYISPQVTDVLGYPPEEFSADPALWTRVVHPDDRSRVAEERSLGEPHSSVYRLIARDGHTVWVHDLARLILGDDGRPRFWQGVLLDVTQERRSQELERDLEREREEGERLRAEDRMKTTFLQVVAHDLRTPLAAILGLAVTMERDDLELTEDEDREMARRIAQNARKLDGIVADFLDLERLTRGSATPHLEPIDLGTIVRDLVAGSESVAERTMIVDVAPLTIRADVAMVERIVENLLNNAVKHTPRDAKIWIRLERAGDALLIVEDDGPGIPEDERARIFEPFRQGTGAASGSGVGLALVAAFAELHAGRAWVEERAGGGASFRVRLAIDPDRAPVVLPDVEIVDQETGAGSSSADSSQA